jgi:hypothetical protein
VRRENYPALYRPRRSPTKRRTGDRSTDVVVVARTVLPSFALYFPDASRLDSPMKTRTDRPTDSPKAALRRSLLVGTSCGRLRMVVQGVVS